MMAITPMRTPGASADTIPLPFQPLSDLARRLAAGDVTSAALTQAFLDQAERHNAKLNAFVALYGDEAMAVAQGLDRMAQAGVRLGPLHGVPFAAKDLFDVEGRPTRAGSLALPDTVAARSATAVQRLRRAGMVLLGKTSTVEFAFGGWGTNANLGTPWNPWDMERHRVPGGSSSGTAVAIAAGMAPCGLGTDTGGSVRIPAGLCGLVGIKTSPGLVPRSGVFPLSRTHDVVGPLARTVLDAALLLDALQGSDPGDSATAGSPILDLTGLIGRGIAGMTVAFLPPEEISHLSPSVEAVYLNALEILRGCGARLTPLRIPTGLPDCMRVAGDIMSAESYASLRAIVDDDARPVSSDIRQRVRRGRHIGSHDYLALLDHRAVVKRAFLDALGEAAVLVAPTCPIVATPVEDVDESATPLSELGRFVNLLDLCSVATPAGLADGLPASIQVIGRQFDEPRALRVAHAFEQALGHGCQRPAAF